MVRKKKLIKQSKNLKIKDDEKVKYGFEIHVIIIIII